MMASLDGARSLQFSSEETFQYECGPCENESLMRQAKYYCPECQEYLCESCEMSHRRLKISRDHKLLSGSLLPSKVVTTKPPTIIKALCACTTNEVTVYCKEHDDVMCADCKTLKHRSCQTSHIQEASTTFQTKAADLTLQNMNDLKNKITVLQDKRKTDLETLVGMTNKCRDDVKAFKAELISQLDIMEENTLTELDNYDKQERKIAEQHIDTCNAALKKIESEINLFEVAKHCGDRTLLFIYKLQLTKTTENFCKLYTDVSKEVNEPNVMFNRDENLKIADILSLGTVVRSKSNVTETIKYVADMRIKSSRQVDVKQPSDKHQPWITGSIFLPTGELLLCDGNNRNIKLLNEKLTAKEFINIHDSPWDISLISDTEAVTTLPDMKKLQFVQVLPKLKLGRTIQFDKDCYGVAVNGGSIYVSFSDGEVRVIDQNGRTKKSILLSNNLDRTRRFNDPRYIAVTQVGKLYISENNYPVGGIHCLSTDGRTIYSYRDQELNYSRGMYVDVGENVLVCGHDSDNVYVIDKNGKKKNVLLSGSDGLQNPNCICFRHGDNTLVVGGAAAIKLLVFKMD